MGQCGATQSTDSNITWRMCSVCWITMATDTHSEYVILIAFPLQQRLHELASMLCYTYIDCLVMSILHNTCIYRASAFQHAIIKVELGRNDLSLCETLDNMLHTEWYQLQGGSNMTGTDLCVNKPHCAAAVRP